MTENAEHDMDDKTIAVIEKSRTRDIRVSLATFRGTTNVDIRIFAVANATERVPTKKGLTVPPCRLGELINALQEAEREARKAGLIEEKTLAAA